MHFIKTALTALTLLSVPTFAALTAKQMSDNLKMLTNKSMALQRPAQTITIISGPLIVVGLGPFPEIIKGFTEIVTITTTAVAQMQGTPKFGTQAEVTLVADSLRTFVKVHQDLLNILIGKAGLFNTVPFIGAPVAFTLRQLEGVVDTVALMLINLAEDFTSDIANQAGSLSGTITLTIDSYDGLSLKKAKRHARDLSA